MNGIHEVRGSIPLSSTIYYPRDAREVCKPMRLTGLRWSLFLAFAVLLTGAIAGCDNPFDPLNATDKIEGLSHFDFSAGQEHWDSDPEWDGLQIELTYYNEFHKPLDFHDKPHKVVIEIYTEQAGSTTSAPSRLGSLLTSKTVEFANSDDFIRIPIEYYGGYLSLPSTVSKKGCLVIRVFPPEEYPQKELYYPSCGIEIFKPETITFLVFARCQGPPGTPRGAFFFSALDGRFVIRAREKGTDLA